MQELSMNVLDVAENSVRAGATLTEITLCQNTAQKQQTLVIRDNGKGMDAAMVQSVTDPFTTTRTTRKVGLGLPFLKMAAEQTGGALTIESEVGVGTTVTATFTLGHIDLMPLGDMGSTVSILVQSSPDTDFVYRFERDENTYEFDTRDAREILEGVPLNEPQVVLFIRQHVTDGMREVMQQAQ